MALSPRASRDGLAKLHKVFQVVMGWNDSHLHEFRIGAACYGVPDPDFQEDRPVISDKRAVLDQVLKPSISQFSYLYRESEAQGASALHAMVRWSV